MCEILDILLKLSVPTTKIINSSLGYWNDGQIQWAQKGSDLGEVNNGIMATFNNHPTLQILSVCPLTVTLKRDVWYKIQTTIRDLLCKMNKSRYCDLPLGISLSHMHALLIAIFNIPEIIGYPKAQKKKYVCPILQGVFIQKIAAVELCKIIPDCTQIINKLSATAENKKKKLKSIDGVVDLMERGLKLGDLLMKILLQNQEDGARVLSICSALDKVRSSIPFEQYDTHRKMLSDLLQSGVIHLNRVVRIIRHIQPLGVRVDLLRCLDLRNICYLLPEEGIATRYKDIVFKFGQAWALMDGIELYDKNKIIQYYQSSFPTLGIFLRREPSTLDNLAALNEFIRRFLDRVENHPGFSRQLCEEYRNL